MELVIELEIAAYLIKAEAENKFKQKSNSPLLSLPSSVHVTGIRNCHSSHRLSSLSSLQFSRSQDRKEQS